jgi:hypothetical protein
MVFRRFLSYLGFPSIFEDRSRSWHKLLRLTESQMPKRVEAIAIAFLVQIVLLSATSEAQEKTEKNPYPAMAAMQQYLMPDKDSEIAMARSAAPKSISDEAEVMVLGTQGYTTAENGTNGFLCIVERSWGAATDEPEFWNPKVRSPICFNPSAAKTFVPIFLMKTKLVLAGKSKTEIHGAISSAFDKKELPTLQPGAMCYMLSKRQYLNDRGMHWHPHLMFLVPGDDTKSWGGNLPGSPVIAADDPEERVTIFMVWVGEWSDGTPAPQS